MCIRDSLTTDYEARADWEVAQYKEAFLATGGTEKEFDDKDIQVYVDYDVKSETEDQVSFVLKEYNNMAVSYTHLDVYKRQILYTQRYFYPWRRHYTGLRGGTAGRICTADKHSC